MGETRSSFLDTVTDVGMGVMEGCGMPEPAPEGIGSVAVLPVHAMVMRSTTEGSKRAVIRRDCTGTYLLDSGSVV